MTGFTARPTSSKCAKLSGGVSHSVSPISRESNSRRARTPRRFARRSRPARSCIFDGFSYEVKQFAEVNSKSHLVFECEPVDEQYKVGAFVVTVPFEEIVRVEVFSVHPSEKPDDMPQITGFRHYQEPGDKKHPDVGPPSPPH